MYLADLHIHSRFSRATSPTLDLKTLAIGARQKGLAVLGTGDMVHPGWLHELKTELKPDNDGFLMMKNIPEVRFIPTGEISCIYKQDGRTRKIHLNFIAPDLEAAERFSLTLAKIGNISADGRPIFGLSARNLLEIGLSCHPDMLMIPAHIWTPWFSLFGHQSGFDHLEDCFTDLSSHITALETGLSSDPAMNRLISALDKYSLVSFSDAHSPGKLGREATIINGEPSRQTLWQNLTGQKDILGTIEFFPQEGKYYLNGHQKCGPGLTPEETKKLGGLCPVCGKNLTIGVLGRIESLADRLKAPRKNLKPDWHLLPLSELLAEVLEVKNPNSAKVNRALAFMLLEFKSELNLLMETEISHIEKHGGPLLALAIDRMRKGQILAEGGYDGKYGHIQLLTPQDFKKIGRIGPLFENKTA